MMQQDLNIQTPEQKIVQKLTGISQQIRQHVLKHLPYTCRTSLTDAYSFVYSKSIQKPSMSQKLLSTYKELLVDHLLDTVRSFSNQNKIKEFNYFHDCYFRYVDVLTKRVFAYLDRYFIPSRDLGSLHKVARAIFRNQLIGNDEAKKAYMECFIETLGSYRANMALTDNQLYNFSVNMDNLNSDFYLQIKKTYLLQSQNFYKFKFVETKDQTPAHYYPRIYNLAQFEDVIASKCLIWSHTDQSDKLLLKGFFIKELVQSYTDILLGHPRGLIWALQFRKYQILNSIIEVYSRFEGLTKIKQRYYQFIVDQTNHMIEMLDKETDQGKIILTMVNFFEDQNKTLTYGFNKHRQLLVTLGNALETIVGKWQRYGQILFNYCKLIVIRGAFQQQNKQIKIAFEKLTHKDQFVNKCQKWLEETILSQKVDLSRLNQFFLFLHDLCGADNTLKLQNIMKDYTDQNTEMSTGVLKTKVISFYLWERRFKQNLTVDLKLLPYLDSLWQTFQTSYIEKQEKKKLRLLPLASTMILEVKFAFKTIKVRCNLLQGCLILSIAQKSRTIEELRQMINIEKTILESFIQLAKFIEEKQNGYCFNWNANIDGDLDLIVQLQNNSTVNKAVETDRNILLEAAVVRVVKRNKEVSFEQIYDFLCASIKLFKPQPTMVKSTIQKLIKKDFIEQNDKALYIYIE